MKRVTSTSTRIDPDVRCERVYPTTNTTRAIKELVTVGFKLNRNQAIHLARVLLAITQDHSEVDVTAYRNPPRKSDNTFKITVTSPVFKGE